MTTEYREIVVALAVAHYGLLITRGWTSERRDGWIESSITDANALLAALDTKVSPPTAAGCAKAAPSQEGAGSATAAPGGDLRAGLENVRCALEVEKGIWLEMVHRLGFPTAHFDLLSRGLRASDAAIEETKRLQRLAGSKKGRT